MTGKSGKSGLVALKETLNRVFPLVIDPNHKPLAVDDNVNDPDFIKNYNEFVETVQLYISSGNPDLVSTMGDKASMLSQVKVTGRLDDTTLQALHALRNAADSNNSSMLSESAKLTISYIDDVAKEMAALPPDITAQITKAQEKAAIKYEAPAGDANPKETQARELVSLAQSYLGVDEDNPTTDIHADTGRALKNYLKQMKASYPELDTMDFTPQTVNGKTAAFMNELLHKQAQEAGVSENNLHTTLLQLWSLQEKGQQPGSEAMRDLGKTGAMFSLVDYIVSGRLPSGQVHLRPRTDSPWENPVNDRFFGQDVYVDLLNGNTVSNKSLFNPEHGNPQAQKMIREVAKDLGISLHDKIYSRDEVGAIATEIMIRQAKAQCIDEHEISQAMMEGRFNPNQDDIFLAKIGLGKPPRDQARIEQLERIGIPPEEQTDIYFRAENERYRNEIWVDRFGGITDEQAFRLAQRLYPDEIPQNMDLTYEDLKDNSHVQEMINRVRYANGSPARLFEWGGGKGDPFNFQEQYQRLRNEHYLPSLRERVNESGLDLCNDGSPKPANNKADDGLCYADSLDNMDGNCGNIPKKPLDDGKCYADEFAQARGNPCSKPEDEIRANMEDTTGQEADDGKCYAEDIGGVNCTPPEAKESLPLK